LSLFDKAMAKLKFSKPFLRLFALGMILASSGQTVLAQGQPPVVVASKADAEGGLLGSMVALDGGTGPRLAALNSPAPLAEAAFSPE
jgi:hypothetical protein